MTGSLRPVSSPPAFWPSHRMLWLTALLLIPAAALPAARADGLLWLGAAVGAWALIVTADALFTHHRLNGYSVQAEPQLRAELDKEQLLALDVICRESRPPRALRIALDFPVGLDPIEDDILVAAAPTPFRVQMRFRGRIRGNYVLRCVYLGTTSRLGLWELRRSSPIETRILVQPALGNAVRETVKLLAARKHGGQRLIVRAGRGRDFDQLREYVPSDSFADIDWKATARRRTPIVREYQVERTQDIYVCVDASRLSGRMTRRAHGEQVTVLDEFVRTAIMLEYAVTSAGDRFGLVTFSHRLHHFAKATSGRAHDALFRRALYPLQPQMVAPAFDEVCATLRTRIRRRSLLLVMTNLSEPQLADSFSAASRLLAKQHLVVVACPTDQRTRPLFSHADLEDNDMLYAELAGHMLWRRLMEVRAKLAQAGIRMSTVAPQQLGHIATSAYLDIKEQQLL